ncbi:MAG: hypothetical protein JO115_04225 [Pseudonocardiales bacterium]|nr:hypothetical protein [Pseudonocardiales bacterium]MBV9140114.1 hypothetical protein [Pseudonocardiales bacterium]
MTDEIHRRLSAALRAQASTMRSSAVGSGPVGSGLPGERSPSRPVGAVSPRRGPAHARRRLSVWTVLALAVLLGAMAGGLAGVISVW